MRLFQGVTCAVLIVLAFAWPVVGADPVWVQVRSQGFVLFTDTSEAKGRRLLTDLEARLAELGDVLDGIPERQFPIEVFLFEKSADFLEAAPRSTTEVEFDKSAYLVRGPDRIFIVARDKSPEDIVEDVGHALGHVFFERLAWWRPFWLAEGAAEYFRNVGQNPDTKKIAAKDVYTVEDLLKIVPSASYDDDAPLSAAFRIQSHRLLRVLLKEYRPQFRDFLKTLKTSEGAQAKPEASLEELESKLSNYTEVRITPATVPVLKVVEASPDIIAIHRGDLLLAAGRTSEAAQWYNGDSPQARAARAILARFSRSGSEPVRVLDRAARDLPDNGLVQLHFGSLTTQSSGDLSLQAQALERAIKLLPLSGKAHAQLARVYTLMGDAEKGLPHVDVALEKEPEFADEFLMIRAEAYLALSRFDEAIRTAELAAASPHLDRGAKYESRVEEMAQRIRDIRRQADQRRLDQIRADVAATVAQREPPPPPPAPPPPQRFGDIQYDVQSRTPTEVINAPLPRYPDVLIQRGVAGAITLQVRVGADGRVTQATVTNSQVQDLNAATLDAVKRWTFKPATNARGPVPFDAQITVRFRVQ